MLHRGGKGPTCNRRTRKNTNRNPELSRAGPQVQRASMGALKVFVFVRGGGHPVWRLWSGVVLWRLGSGFGAVDVDVFGVFGECAARRWARRRGCRCQRGGYRWVCY